MATYKNGPLGGFSGKLGPVVGAQWRGIPVLRAAPQKTTKPPTEAQRLQRQKFKDVLTFLNPVAMLLATTFKTQPTDRNGFELAKSYHLKEAMQPTDTGWRMLYPKVLISSGELRGLNSPHLTVQANEVLHLQWADDSGQAMANATDALLLVLYMPTLGQFEVFKDIAQRADASADVVYPDYYHGVEAQCWATFGTANGSKYAVSTYVGVVVL